MSEPIRLSHKLLQIEHCGPARRRWYARVPAEHSIETVLHPAYFSQCLEGVKAVSVPDLIEIEPEDLSWSLTVTVLSADANARRVVTRLRGEVEQFGVELAAEQIAAGYDLRYVGRVAGWGVFRGAELLDQGFRTATAALERLNAIAPVNAKPAKAA